MSYFDSQYKLDLDYLKKIGRRNKQQMANGGKIVNAISPFVSMGVDALIPGSGAIVDPLMSLLGNNLSQGDALSSIADSKNQLNASINPYQMKKGGYLKDENTYVTKDGRETRRGLWANVYLKKKKQGKQEGGMIDNSMVDGGMMVNISDDAQMVKANNPQATDSVETPQAFLDHNEMLIDMPNGGKFVFSDYLKDEDTGESFASIAKGLVDKRDNGEISEEEYNMYITELANDNEKQKTMKKKTMKMKNGGKMMYVEGGMMDPMQGGEAMMEGESMMQENMENQMESPDVMGDMGVEGDMGASMEGMTDEGFPVNMPDGQQYMFSPDLKEQSTGQSFAAIAQQLTDMFKQGQMQQEQYMQAMQQLAQQQEQMKGSMSEEQKAGMKCGGYMKSKKMGGGYMPYDKFNKMMKRS